MKLNPFTDSEVTHTYFLWPQVTSTPCYWK